MEISDWLSIVALGISGLALYRTYISANKQDELNEMQISEKKEEIDIKNNPKVTANIIPFSQGAWLIRVSNIGGKKAINVDLKFVEDPKWNEINKFPVEILGPGKHVDIRISPDKGLLSDRARCILTWENESGRHFNDEIDLII